MNHQGFFYYIPEKGAYIGSFAVTAHPFGGGWISASNRVTVDAVKYLLFMVESFQYSPNSGNNQFKKRSKSLILAPPLSRSLLPCQLGQHISSWRTTSTLGNRYPCRIG